MQKRWMMATFLVVAVATALAAPRGKGATAVGRAFEISAKSGYIVLNDVLVGPGQRIVSKFKAPQAAKCLDGTADDDYCRDYIENGTGTAFLFCDSDRAWRFRTAIGGSDTELTGNVDPTGEFIMSGRHALSGADLFFVGKAKLQKGTILPTKISGTLYFTSTSIEEFGQVKFKTVRMLSQ